MRSMEITVGENDVWKVSAEFCRLPRWSQHFQTDFQQFRCRYKSVESTLDRYCFFSDIGKDPVWITRDATWIARQTVHSHLFSHRGWTVILMADMNLLLAGLRALLDNYFSFLTVSVSATTLVLFSNEFKLTFLRSGNLRRRKRYSRRSTSRNLFRVHVTIDSTIR